MIAIRFGRVVALAIALAGTATLTAASPAHAASCLSTTRTPTTTDPSGAYRYVADNFETGDFRRWSGVVREGDASARVTTLRRHDGYCGGRLVVTSRWDSRANVYRNLPSTTREVWLTGWFRVDGQGSSGSNVPTFRLFYGSQRIADVHRQNVSGELWLRTSNGSGGWRFAKLGRTMALGVWYKIKVHVYANWSSSDIDVWVNNTLLYHSTAHWLPVGRLTKAMIGAEHRRQVMDLSFDTAVVAAR